MFLRGLMFGSVLCVPLACYFVGVLYRRAGMKSGWTVALNLLAGLAIFGFVFSFLNFNLSSSAMIAIVIVLILVPAILVTAAAGYLAFRRWPGKTPKSGGKRFAPGRLDSKVG